jgi:hypothetical protein
MTTPRSGNADYALRDGIGETEEDHKEEGDEAPHTS